MVALDAAEDVLQPGELFGIFPEGTRSRDGYLYKGRTGVARLALKVGCPIYPVGVIGTDKIQPPDAKMPKLRKECTIQIGRPIKMDRYRDRADDRLVLRQITDEVMFEIRELTGQEYRNVYAGKTSDTEDVEQAKVGTVGEVAVAARERPSDQRPARCGCRRTRRGHGGARSAGGPRPTGPGPWAASSRRSAWRCRARRGCPSGRPTDDVAGDGLDADVVAVAAPAGGCRRTWCRPRRGRRRVRR